MTFYLRIVAVGSNGIFFKRIKGLIRKMFESHIVDRNNHLQYQRL